jgi:hypothetical protein
MKFFIFKTKHDVSLGYHVRVYIGYNAPSTDEERMNDSEISVDRSIGGLSEKM